MPKRGKYKTYDEVTLQTALERIRQGTLSVNAASRQYGIPKTTLLDKIHGRTPVVSRQGPSPVLSKQEEDDLVTWLLGMSRIGYGRTKQELLNVVKNIMDEDGRPNPFRNNKPGRDWVKGFLKRHPEVSFRTPEKLGKERSTVSVEKIYKWFDGLEAYFQGEEVSGGMSLFKDPRRIFNADESGFPLAGGKMGKVLAPKGARDVYYQGSSDKTQITVLACANAAGVFLPPMMVFSGTRFRFNPTEGGPEGTILGRSETGWMDSAVFFEWVANHFLPSVNHNFIPLPVVLFVDGHSTHINLETAQFCKANEIVLYCLPPHTTHVLQPLDVACFRSLKKSWGDSVRAYQMSNPGSQITKRSFAPVFRLSWEDAATPTNAINGFRKCGLYPLDRRAIDITKLEPSKIYQQQADPLPDRQTRQSTQQSDETGDKPASSDVAAPPPPPPALQSDRAGPSQPRRSTQPSTSLFQKHLRYPTAKKSQPKSRQPENLPKAVSGDKFIQYLQQKEQKKAEDESRRQTKKEERERKRTAKTGGGKKSHKARKASTPTSSDSDVDLPKVDENICSTCLVSYDNDDDNWIGCEHCDRWFHKTRRCSGIDGAEEMTAEEVAELDWFCDLCL